MLPTNIVRHGGDVEDAPIPDLPVFAGTGTFDLEADLKATSVNPLRAVEIAEKSGGCDLAASGIT